jgi:hypothetical protein
MTTTPTPAAAQRPGILAAAAAVLRAEFPGLATTIAVLDEKAAALQARADYAAGRAQCPDCGVYTSDPAHACVVYDGPPCVTCGQPTVCYQVGAPGYGTGRACRDGHDEPLNPHGILTLGDVR